MRSQGKDIYELEKLPVYRMLLHIAAPVMLSLLVQALYTLVDGIYVSRIDEAAISAVSLAFIVQNIEVALFSGIATGINAVISKSLGENDGKEARNATLNGTLIQLVISLAFILFGVFGTRAYFAFSTTDETVIDYGVRYLMPCLLAAVVTGISLTQERFLNSVGMTTYVLIAHAVGSVINIILDPIMIFGFGIIPAMGIAGAAYATILSQIICLGILFLFNKRKNKALFNGTRPCFGKAQIGKICKVGVPTSFLGVATALGNYVINRVVLHFSTTALAAYGLYIKVQTVLNMPPQGIAVALVTMFAFFYGKKSYEKIKETVKWGMIFLAGYGLMCTLLLNIFPYQVLGLFETSEHLREIAVVAFRVIGLTYFPSAPFHCYTSFFQATERSHLSLVFIIARQFFARIPMAIILSTFGVINLIWWCYPISEVVSDSITIVVFIWALKKTAKQIRGDLNPVVEIA